MSEATPNENTDEIQAIFKTASRETFSQRSSPHETNLVPHSGLVECREKKAYKEYIG